MKNLFISVCTAIRFLTILPIPWFREEQEEHYRHSVHFFVFVGLLLGIIGYLLTSILLLFAPPLIVSCLVIFYLSGISGFLHLDGFADTADGFLSHRSRDDKLNIMRDSRTGAMGVISLIFLLIFKFAALSSIDVENLPVVVLLLPLSGRFAIILTMTYLPYARTEGGLGELFYLQKKYRIPLISSLLFVVCGLVTNGQLTLIAFLVSILSAILFGYWCRKAIGGTTGDTFGAVCELTEAIVALSLALFLCY